MAKFYAVVRGRQVGIFTSWAETEKQVKGFSDAKYKSFKTEAQAKEYLEENGDTLVRSPQSPRTAGFGNTDSAAAGSTEDDADVLSAQFEAVGIHDDQQQRRQYIPSKYQGMILAFCKGSSLNHTREGREGAWAVVSPSHPEITGSAVMVDPNPTNNRSDFTAAVEALTRANRIDPNARQTLVIFTNLEYLVNSMNNWINRWMANGWRRADGDPVENRDLFEQILAAQEGRDVVWRHVTAGSPDWERGYMEEAQDAAQALVPRTE